jgi:hypothetical protein
MAYGHEKKALLDRIVAMLTKPGQRGYAVHVHVHEKTKHT